MFDLIFDAWNSLWCSPLLLKTLHYIFKLFRFILSLFCLPPSCWTTLQVEVWWMSMMAHCLKCSLFVVEASFVDPFPLKRLAAPPTAEQKFLLLKEPHLPQTLIFYFSCLDLSRFLVGLRGRKTEFHAPLSTILLSCLQHLAVHVFHRLSVICTLTSTSTSTCSSGSGELMLCFFQALTLW